MPPTKRVARTLPRDDSEEEVAAEPVEDEVPEPPRPRRVAPAPKGAAPHGGSIRRGWGGAQEQIDRNSSFAQAFIPNETTQVVKFLEDEPYASYARHWVERINADGKRGQRSFTCLEVVGRECPLCQIGDRPQSVAAFNVALVGDDGHPVLKSWDVGPKIFNTLKGYSNDPKVAPLTKGYFLVSKTGKKGSVNHNINPVPERALEEDYDIPAPSQADFDRLGKYDVDIIEIPKVKDMQEMAEEQAD